MTKLLKFNLCSTALLALICNFAYAGHDCRDRVSIELSDLGMGTYFQPKVNKIPLNSDAQSSVTFGNAGGTQVQVNFVPETDKILSYDIWLDSAKLVAQDKAKLNGADQISVQLDDMCNVVQYTSAHYTNDPSKKSEVNFIVTKDFCKKFETIDPKTQKRKSEEFTSAMMPGQNLEKSNAILAKSLKTLVQSTKSELNNYSFENITHMNNVCLSRKYGMSDDLGNVIRAKVESSSSVKQQAK